MGSFVRLVRLDLTLQARSFIYPATLVSTAMICGFIVLLPGERLSPRLTAFFVFMDPATIGLSFVGAMVLMEKAQGTLFALGVSPVKPAAYVGAKTVTLTMVTFASSMVVLWVATGGGFSVVGQMVALTLCSTLAVLMGLACVAGAASMNELVVRLLVVTVLLYVPLLGHFDLLSGPYRMVVAIIPSHAMLVSLEGAIDSDAVSVGSRAGAALYLLAWIVAGWRWVLRAFERSILREGR